MYSQFNISKNTPSQIVQIKFFFYFYYIFLKLKPKLNLIEMLNKPSKRNLLTGRNQFQLGKTVKQCFEKKQ